jgi:hypothetical protein
MFLLLTGSLEICFKNLLRAGGIVQTPVLPKKFHFAPCHRISTQRISPKSTSETLFPVFVAYVWFFGSSIRGKTLGNISAMIFLYDILKYFFFATTEIAVASKNDHSVDSGEVMC